MDEQTATDLFIFAVTKAEIELGLALLPEGKQKDNLSVAVHEMFGEFFPNRCLSFDDAEAAKYAVLVENIDDLKVISPWDFDKKWDTQYLSAFCGTGISQRKGNYA